MFSLVKPFTPIAHSALCYIYVGSSQYCQVSHLKYWSKIHFNQGFGSDCTESNSLSPNEVIMKEEIQSWFQRLGYEEGFGPSEFPLAEVRKKRIDTYVILSAVTLEESEYFW